MHLDLAKLARLADSAPALEQLLPLVPRFVALLERLESKSLAEEQPKPLREIRDCSARAAVMFERRNPDLVKLAVAVRGRTRLYRAEDVRTFVASRGAR